MPVEVWTGLCHTELSNWCTYVNTGFSFISVNFRESVFHSSQRMPFWLHRRCRSDSNYNRSGTTRHLCTTPHNWCLASGRCPGLWCWTSCQETQTVNNLSVTHHKKLNQISLQSILA